MKDDRLPENVLFGQPSWAKRKASHPHLGWEDVIKTDLKEMRTSREGVMREALNRLRWRRSVRSYAGPRWICAVVSFSSSTSGSSNSSSSNFQSYIKQFVVTNCK